MFCYQKQVPCAGKRNQSDSRSHLLLQQFSIFWYRDLVVSSLQYEIFHLSRWCPPLLEGRVSIAVLCMPAAWGVRQGLIICHAIGMFAGLPTMYFMSFRTSASVDAGLKIVFNASSPCGVGGTFPPAAKRMTVRAGWGWSAASIRATRFPKAWPATFTGPKFRALITPATSVAKVWRVTPSPEPVLFPEPLKFIR